MTGSDTETCTRSFRETVLAVLCLIKQHNSELERSSHPQCCSVKRRLACRSSEQSWMLANCWIPRQLVGCSWHWRNSQQASRTLFNWRRLDAGSSVCTVSSVMEISEKTKYTTFKRSQWYLNSQWKDQLNAAQRLPSYDTKEDDIIAPPSPNSSFSVHPHEILLFLQRFSGQTSFLLIHAHIIAPLHLTLIADLVTQSMSFKITTR